MNNDIKKIDLNNLGFTPSQELIDMVNDANQAMAKAEQSKQDALNIANSLQSGNTFDNSVVSFDVDQLIKPIDLASLNPIQNISEQLPQQPITTNNSIESIQLSAGAGKIDLTPGAIVAEDVSTSKFVELAAGAEKIDPTPGAIPSGMIQIPNNVHQTGITKNYTNYDYFYGKWNNGTAQRALSEQWNASGRTSNRGIATLNGRYLVALSPKFGGVGQNVDICLENGQVIPATIADSKGGDAQSEWGHRLGGGIDIVEWESSGSKENIDISGWQGVKVSGIKKA